jgi:hypothetical protein
MSKNDLIKEPSVLTDTFSYRNKNNVINNINVNKLIIIKYDIRNMKNLNKEQIDYIKMNCSDNDKNEIIELFNDCTKLIIEIIMSTE